MIKISQINPRFSIINIYFVYYVLLEFFISSGKWDKFSVLYFAMVLPILAFIVFSLKSVLKWQFSKSSVFLILILVCVAPVTILRADLATIYNLCLFVIPVISILETNSRINIRLINTLFILSIIFGIVLYHLEINRFGYIPFIHSVGGLEPDWKISIFPRTPASGFFALFIVILNYYFNSKRSRFILYFLGFYFMLFSGLRSTLLLFSVFASFELFSKFVKFKARRTYLLLGLIYVFVALFTVSGSSLIQLVQKTDNKFVKSLLAKSTFTNISEVEGQENYRAWLWGVHFNIYKENLLFGVGSYDIKDYEQKDAYGKTDFEGSESFVTRWLARIGLPIIFLFLLLYKIYMDGMLEKNKYKYILPILLTLILFTYGSFMMPYNFMYFLIFGTINNKNYI
ncbi:O-antigen ligase family protein [Marivirga sp.]|uniref:O-antigen ligase family protein n=1 Tax=Marivirga sp. TaxID=2018662 RepID=UPI003DA72702